MWKLYSLYMCWSQTQESCTYCIIMCARSPVNVLKYYLSWKLFISTCTWHAEVDMKSFLVKILLHLNSFTRLKSSIKLKAHVYIVCCNCDHLFLYFQLILWKLYLLIIIIYIIEVLNWLWDQVVSSYNSLFTIIIFLSPLKLLWHEKLLISLYK